MTPGERDLLTRFLDDLRRVPGGARDAEAAKLIEDSLSSRPEALYLLVQHALLADQALHEAQRRIATLEDQAKTAAPTPPSGTGAPSPWGAPSAQPPRPAPQNAGFFGGGIPAQPGGFSSFLRNAASTAAGFAAGEFLFEGLSNLFGAHHSGSFLGGGYSPNVENITINEYRGADAATYDDGNIADDSYDSGDAGDAGDMDIA